MCNHPSQQTNSPANPVSLTRSCCILAELLVEWRMLHHQSIAIWTQCFLPSVDEMTTWSIFHLYAPTVSPNDPRTRASLARICPAHALSFPPRPDSPFPAGTGAAGGGVPRPLHGLRAHHHTVLRGGVLLPSHPGNLYVRQPELLCFGSRR